MNPPLKRRANRRFGVYVRMLNFFENVLAARDGGKYESLIMIVIFVIIAIFNVIKSITKAAKENKEKQEAVLRPKQMRQKTLDGHGLQQQATHNKQVHQPQAQRQASPDIERRYHQQEFELQKSKAQAIEIQRRKKQHEIQRLRQQQKKQLAQAQHVEKPTPKAVKPKVEQQVMQITNAEDITEMPLDQLRQAIILREILDKPVALR